MITEFHFNLCGDGHGWICSIGVSDEKLTEKIYELNFASSDPENCFFLPTSVPSLALSCHVGWEDGTLCCACLFLMSQMDDCIVLAICAFENTMQRDNLQNQTPWWGHFYNSRSLHIISSFYLWLFEFTLKIHRFSAK